MRPTFLPGDRLLVDPAGYRSRPPVTGDLVVVESPEEPGRRLLKRVAGIGGDRLAILRDGIRRLPTGRDLSRENTPPQGSDTIEEVEIPADRVYLLSDAPRTGRDSRQFGSIETRSILGRPWYRYAPRNRRGPVE